MKSLSRISTLAASFLMPLSLAFADTNSSSSIQTDIKNLITFINDYVVYLIFAIAFVVFLWGVFQYFIAGAANEEQRTKGKQFILYGLIGFVVMVSVWAIVSIAQVSLGLDSGSRPPIPTFNSANDQPTNSNTTSPLNQTIQ